LLDAGDDAQLAAALPAGLDVDGEHALEALRPGEAPLAVGGRGRPVRAASSFGELESRPISGALRRRGDRPVCVEEAATRTKTQPMPPFSGPASLIEWTSPRTVSSLEETRHTIGE
jgi:hypothetical protein